MSLAETPLVPGSLHGLRSWRIDATRRRLAGLVYNELWPAGPEPMVAACAARPEGHAVDEGMHECSCGVYAYHPCAGVARRLRAVLRAHGQRIAPDTHVMGVMRAWGRVELHATGFRAQFAKPHALVRFHRTSRADGELIESVAGFCGAELWDLRGWREYWERCEAAGLTGIDPTTREDLLAPAREILLRPAASAFVGEGSASEPVGGAGYELLGAACEFGPRGEGGRCDDFGSLALRVVGSHYRARALQDPAFEPGRPLRLVRDTANLHDGGAIAVWDEHMRLQAGFVAKRWAKAVGEMLDSNRLADTRAIWQWRNLRSGERTELWMLLARSAVRLATESEVRADEIPF